MSVPKLPQAQQTTRLSGMQMQQALLGTVRPVLIGTNRVSTNLIWYGDFHSKKAKQGAKGGSGGALGKGGQAAFVYNASILALLGEGGPTGIMGIDSVWDQDGMYVVDKVTETQVVPNSGPFNVVVNNPGAGIFNLDYGVAQPTPFSVAKNDYGDPNGPAVITGTQNVPLTKVGSSPGPGQYSVNSTGTYTFNAAQANQNVQIGYSFFRYKIADKQLAAVPASGPFTVTVTHQPNFQADLGVQYYPSGIALTKVGGSPTVTGTYNPNGGNYQFASGDAGQGVEISYQWNNVNTDQNAPTVLNLTLIQGTPGQAPWSFLTSNHPGQALGYTGCAMIASNNLYLGFVPNLPNYSFEVGAPYAFFGGIPDACPSDAINAVLTDPISGVSFDPKWIDSSLQGIARNYWLANNFFISEYLNTQSSAATTIGRWLEASLVAPFWSEGKLKFIPAGTQTAVANGATFTPQTTPVVTFSDSDFIAAAGKDPITVSRVSWQDAYNDIKVEWSVRINSYNRDIMNAQDEASIALGVRRPEGPRSYKFITTQTAAQFAANMRLQRYQGVRNTYQFTVKGVYGYLEPMDVVLIPDPKLLGPSVLIPVRITKLTNDSKKGIAINAEDLPFTVFNTPQYSRELVQASNDTTTARSQPDPTILTLLEIPATLVNGQSNFLYIFGAGGGNNWGGCDLYISNDNVNFNYLDSIRVAGRTGTLTATLPSHSDPDTVDTLSVQVQGVDNVLTSVPHSTADAQATLSVLVDGSGNLEFIAYATVALVGPSTYNLTYLRRGLQQSTIRAFNAGSLFARLDGSSVNVQYPDSQIGQTLYVKALSVNQFGLMEQGLGDVTAVSIVLNGTKAVFTGTIPASTPLNNQSSILPTVVNVPVSFTSTATPQLNVTVTAGTIYWPDGHTTPVGASNTNYSTWNSTAVAFPAAPGSGTNFNHYGLNVVWQISNNTLQTQQYGPTLTTTSASPWNRTNAVAAFADGLAQILITGDAWLGTDSGSVHTEGGTAGSTCPLKGTIIKPLGGPAGAISRQAFEWVKITLQDGKSLTATPEHPIFSDSRGKIHIREVNMGEEVVTEDGLVPVTEVQILSFPGLCEEVQMHKSHLYWANGILSHNFKAF